MANRMPTTGGGVIMQRRDGRECRRFRNSDFAEDWALNIGLAFRGPIEFLLSHGRLLRVHAKSLRARPRSRAEVARAFELVQRRVKGDPAAPMSVRLSFLLLALPQPTGTTGHAGREDGSWCGPIGSRRRRLGGTAAQELVRNRAVRLAFPSRGQLRQLRRMLQALLALLASALLLLLVFSPQAENFCNGRRVGCGLTTGFISTALILLVGYFFLFTWTLRAARSSYVRVARESPERFFVFPPRLRADPAARGSLTAAVASESAFARRGAPILVVGEAGSGKTTFLLALHAPSGARGGGAGTRSIARCLYPT